ncbi:MAG: serine/threonine protein kinase [Thermodesulfovibrionales bacterium]
MNKNNDPIIEISQRISSLSKVYYRVLQQLGAGANSVVYLVLSLGGPYQGVLFALKIFTRVADKERLDRFAQEAKFLEVCNHPAIMKIYDNGVYTDRSYSGDKDYPFVIAEYLPETLQDKLRMKMPIAEKLSNTLHLVSALSHLHRSNPAVMHRDIKPANIFIKGRSCVLGDFGLMKFDGAPGTAESDILRQSHGPGMPRSYRTPDLVDYALTGSGLTTKTDVFQLGLVLAEMFCGKNPCKQNDDRLSPVELEEIGNVSSIHGERIRGILREMLEKDPNIRPAATDLIDSWEGVFREVVVQLSQIEGRVF